MRKSEIRVLTTLRGIAAMLIVVHHVGLLMLPSRTHMIAPALMKCALLGMSLFFVLSGFVIHYNYMERISQSAGGVADFLVARFARLYPLYLPFIIVNFVYIYSIYPSYSAFLVYYVFGVQSWVYKIVAGLNVTLSLPYAGAAWSISSEVLLYLFYVPFVLSRRNRPPSIRRGFALLALGIIGRTLIICFSETVGRGLAEHFGAAPNLPAGVWLSYFSPYGRLPEFIAGIGLGELWMAGPLSALQRRTVSLVGCVGLLYVSVSLLDAIAFSVPGFFGFDVTQIGYSISIPFLILLLCFYAPEKANAFSEYVGETSYSI